MNPTEPTEPAPARPIRVRFVNNSDHARWNFRLGRYLAERLPCLQAPPGHDARTGALRWSEELGPLEADERQRLRELDQLSPPAPELPPQATIKDAITELGTWVVETVRAALPDRLVDLLAGWLAAQWAHYLPQSVLGQCDWREYLWRCIRLPDNARLVVNGRDYGVLPCLAGRVETHPAGLQDDYQGDVNWRWRHEEISRTDAGAHPTDADRRQYTFATFYTPAHLCDTLEYSFAEIRHVLDPVEGWRRDAGGDAIRRFVRMDEPHRLPVTADNGEGYVRHDDGRLVLEDYDPWIPHLLVHFHRGGHALNWLANSIGGLLPRVTDHWVVRDQELRGSLAEQHISAAMPHFVYQTIAVRLAPVLDSFRRQVRALIESGGALPDPLWLRTGPLRGTLDAARHEAVQRRHHNYNFQEAEFYGDHLSPDHPQSNALSRALDWLDGQQIQPDAPVAGMGGIDWQSRILLAADLAGQVQNLRVQRRQSLIDAHRQFAGLFEGLLRAVFSHRCFQPANGRENRISFLFCEWVAERDGRVLVLPGRQGPRSHAWYQAFCATNNPQGMIDAAFIAAAGTTAPRLADIIRDASARAAAGTGPVPPSAFVRELLAAPRDEVGTCAWTYRLVAACRLRRDGTDWRPEDRTVVNLLFVGLLLIEIRNLLMHGQEPLEVERPDGTALVTNYETGVTVSLDAESLELCFRLFVAAAALIVVVGGLNPRRLDDRGRALPEPERQAEQGRIDRDTADRELFLGLQ